MTVMLVLACLGFITGCFFLLELTPADFAGGLFGMFLDKPKSLKEEVYEETQRKKNLFRKTLEEVQEILSMTGRGKAFSSVCTLSLCLFLIGAFAAIVLGNYILAPVLAAGFLCVPFWYIKITANHYKRNLASELETALSIITTAYLRNEDLLTAVEENVHYLNPPVQCVFQDFSAQLRLVNSDVEAGIKTLKGRIANEVFQEWCDALSDCQVDRSLKSTLIPIVNKLSDMRIVNAELDYMVTEPRKEFITMAMLVAANVPLMYFLNPDWYSILMHTPVGKVVLATCTALNFICTACVLKLTKPLEYRR